MKKGLFFMFVVLVLSLSPIALAVQLNIQTLPNHRVSAFFREPGKLTNVDSQHVNTANGDISITSELFNFDEMDLVLSLKKDGEVVINRNFDSLLTNKIIYINFIPGLDKDEMLVDNFEKPVVEEVKTSEEILDETTNLEETQKEKIEEKKVEKSDSVVATGKSVEEIKDSSSLKIVYYILGAVVGIFVLIFAIQTGRRMWNSSDNYKVIKYSHSDERKIADAERKLAEAKLELDEIKNRKKKLVEAKKRFEKDKDELKKLGVGDYY
ncbi:MAG: hypothetical protein AABW83_00960 [Nanoarchaeota archaeon]